MQWQAIFQSDCDLQRKWILCNNQLSGGTKKKLQSTFQSQTCIKKDHGHCLVVSCPCDPLHMWLVMEVKSDAVKNNIA